MKKIVLITNEAKFDRIPRLAAKLITRIKNDLLMRAEYLNDRISNIIEMYGVEPRLFLIFVLALMLIFGI